MHTDMQLRIHSYANDSRYHATLEYLRDGLWQDLTSRICSSEPIGIHRTYRQLYTCSLTLDNTDGLLSPKNRTSAYNLNGASAYDPLLDEARKMRVKPGIYCYSSLTSGKTVTASSAPTAGALSKLVDATYGDETDESDTDWVHWSGVASGAALWAQVDLGTAQLVRHGCLSFLSKTSVSPQIELPSTVQFAYSTDGTNFTNIGSAFDMSEYTDSRSGQRYLAWFTDANVTARYIRATITNVAEENEIYVDEFDLWGGNTETFKYITGFTGYLGDSIDLYARTGYIELAFEDTRKKENDNRLAELTKEYKDQRPEQIIYDLLTNTAYWIDGVAEATYPRNPGFEDGNSQTAWTRSDDGTYVKWGTAGGAERARTGKCIAAIYGYNNLSHAAQYIQQADIPVTGGAEHTLSFWSAVVPGTSGPYTGWYVSYHVEIQCDGGAALVRYPSVGSYTQYTPAVVLDPQYTQKTFAFTPPEAATECSIKVVRDAFSCGEGTYSYLHWLLDDFSLTADAEVVVEGYGTPLSTEDIGWDGDDNLSNFTVTRWQGQNGTILDYCNELAQLIGWVYDADGAGVRQFWEPEHNRLTASPFCNFWLGKGQIIGPDNVQLNFTGNEIRNRITLVGYEKGNKEVPRIYRHAASIARYGTRAARITEPLIRDATASDKLGKALLRDFAYARENVTANVRGGFDLDRPKYICTFNEPLRSYLDKSDMWAIESIDTDIVTEGRGYCVSTLQTKRFVSGMPAPVSGVQVSGGSVLWTASTEVDIDGYYVYYSSAADGTFTKRDKVTGTSDDMSGASSADWVYVTAVNLEGIESEPSALVQAVATTEAATWGITNLAATVTDNAPSVTLDLAWTPSLPAAVDYMIVSLAGPGVDATPTALSGQAQISPVDATAIHYFANITKADLSGGVTYYWRLAIHEVVINDNHFRFGTPLYSNAASAVWPA